MICVIITATFKEDDFTCFFDELDKAKEYVFSQLNDKSEEIPFSEALKEEQNCMYRKSTGAILPKTDTLIMLTDTDKSAWKLNNF